MIIVAPRGELRSSTNSSITCEFSLVVLLAVDGQDQRDLSMPDMPILSRKVLFIIAVFAVADGQAGLKAGEIDLTARSSSCRTGFRGPSRRPCRCWSRRCAGGRGSAGTPCFAGRLRACPSSRSARPACSTRYRSQYRELVSLAARRQGTRRLSHPDRRWSGCRRRSCVVGNDARGVLFGVGRLLRELRMTPGHVTLPAALNLASSPKYPLRGHQLGYRPKTNSYDAWDLAQWDRYIRELAVFGTNAIELIPPALGRRRQQPPLSRCRRWR